MRLLFYHPLSISTLVHQSSNWCPLPPTPLFSSQVPPAANGPPTGRTRSPPSACICSGASSRSAPPEPRQQRQRRWVRAAPRDGGGGTRAPRSGDSHRVGQAVRSLLGTTHLPVSNLAEAPLSRGVIADAAAGTSSECAVAIEDDDDDGDDRPRSIPSGLVPDRSEWWYRAGGGNGILRSSNGSSATPGGGAVTKTIVFSQFANHGFLIAKHLKAFGIGFLYLHKGQGTVF